MSDRDSSHTLAELQAARAEVDRLRELVRWRKWPDEKPEKNVDFFCANLGRFFVADFVNGLWLENYGTDELLTKVEYWRPIGPLPGKGGE